MPLPMLERIEDAKAGGDELTSRHKATTNELTHPFKLRTILANRCPNFQLGMGDRRQLLQQYRLMR